MAARETLRDVATAPGTVVPAAAGDWTIYAPDVAEIAELPKAAGDTVTTGDMLVRFDIASRTQELAALQLETIAAEQALERAAADLARQTSLLDRGLVSRSSFESSRAAHAGAQSVLSQTRARFAAAETGQDTAVVRARFNGVVADVWRAKGDIVGGATEPVMRVIDPARVQVSVHLPLAQVARVVPGQTAIVRAIGGGTDEPGTVVLTPPAASPDAPTAEIRLAFQNPIVMPLDTPVSVELLLDVRTGVIAVPSVAIQRDQLGPYLMVAAENGYAERRDVRLGLVAGELTQVATGLQEGERVIVSGLTMESAGLPVTIVR
jgi:RND family efflux transporter MFP subunit